MITDHNKKNLCTVLLMTAFFSCILTHACEAKSVKNSQPMYMRSGIIGGTTLTYENLDISKSGRVSVVVVNQSRNTLSFSSNFSFYDEKSNYISGFTIEGNIGSMSKNCYETDFPEYKMLKKASYMKVLGRGGMAVGD